MNILKYLLGKTTATSATIAAEIEKAEGELTAVQSKITAALAGLATFTDEQHVAAESKQAELMRSSARLVARIVELQFALTTARSPLRRKPRVLPPMPRLRTACWPPRTPLQTTRRSCSGNTMTLQSGSPP
jgi:capsule polysaccharide export protein KpsE/RkpR